MTENTRANRVRDVMTPTDQAAHPDHPVSEAVERMHTSGMQILPVVDGDEVVGLLRMRDIETDPDAEHPAAAVRDAMFAEILYCFAENPIEEAIALMEKTGYDEYLVVDAERRLIGHVTLSALREGRPHEAKRAEIGDGEVEAHKSAGGGRKQGGQPHELGGFSVRPVVRN